MGDEDWGSPEGKGMKGLGRKTTGPLAAWFLVGDPEGKQTPI